MTKVTIEIQYLPSIALYSLMVNHDSFFIEQFENYQKGSYRNKAHIMSAQGPLALSIPLVAGKNNQRSIRAVEIDNKMNWRLNHMRGIHSCYGKSPYYEYYIEQLETLINSKEKMLFDYNFQLIIGLNKLLNIEQKVHLTQSYISQIQPPNLDRRAFISPKTSKQTQLNAAFDFKYYDQVFIEEQGFAPNLSILDLLFCQGPEAIIYLKSIYKRKNN